MKDMYEVYMLEKSVFDLAFENQKLIYEKELAAESSRAYSKYVDSLLITAVSLLEKTGIEIPEQLQAFNLGEQQ